MISETRTKRAPEGAQVEATRSCDAIVVGGGVAGLVVSLLLTQYGYRTVLAEKSPRLGGLDRSFTNPKGRRFDFGLHVLDYMRSEFTTRLFQHVCDGRVHKLERDRGIVLAGHVVPYNVGIEQWPAALRSLFPEGDVVDTLGTEPPTRENLTAIYGRRFADLIFDEALASYPSDHRHLSFGVPEERLVSGLYPWFFPRVPRSRAELDESRRYQDRIRERSKEYMLYPDEGGFGAFVEALTERLSAQGASLCTGVDDLELDYDADSGRVRAVRIGGELWSAPRVYWCAPAGVLARLLGQPAKETRPDRFVLGSFQLAEPVLCRHNELIAADPAHLVNRISFPGKLALERDDLVQLEFAFPKDSELAERDPSFWMESWFETLVALGVVARDNRIVDFDFKTVLTFYNSYGIDGERMPEVDLGALPPESNLRPVLPTISKANINRRVPQYLEFLAKDLATNPAPAAR